MRWIRKAVWRVVKRAWEDNELFELEEQQQASRKQARLTGNLISKEYESDVVEESQSPRARSMSFRLYKCVGGHILETNVYNRREDEHEHTLYMIKEEEDFAKQVSHSIMLEMMKQ